MRDEPLTYSSSAGKREGTVVLKVAGPLTLSNLFTFQEEFRAMKPQVLILDLNESPYMDSAGLGHLANYYVSAERDGRKLLLTGVNARIAALLSLTKLDTVLQSFNDPEAAEASY